MRSMEQHDCPALKKAPSTFSATASATSASWRTYDGSLPPSSSPVPMKRAAAAACMACPPSTEPVKATKPTRSSAIMAAMASCVACTCWNTPSGRPAAANAAE